MRIKRNNFSHFNFLPLCDFLSRHDNAAFAFIHACIATSFSLPEEIIRNFLLIEKREQSRGTRPYEYVRLLIFRVEVMFLYLCKYFGFGEWIMGPSWHFVRSSSLWTSSSSSPATAIAPIHPKNSWALQEWVKNALPRFKSAPRSVS